MEGGRGDELRNRFWEYELWKQLLEFGDIDDDDASPPTQQLSESYLMGFIVANIVGLRHYRGRINGRELVGLVREPLNPYDTNAIKVLNTRTDQVGHVERSVAAVLAPLVDSRLVTVEGIVPRPPSGPTSFRLPCQIHLFALPDAFPAVRSALASAGILLISSSDPGFSLSEAAVVQETKPKDKRKEGERSVDEIFALVEKGDAGRAPPVEPNGEVIASELFQHQKEGLGWLVWRENSGDLPPFWAERDFGFLNLLTNYQTHERPEPLRGGVFADDMGLGKTLTMLSLIATNRPSATAATGDGSTSLGGGGVSDVNKSMSSKNDVNHSKRRKVGGGGGCFSSAEVEGPMATLVVCPSSVLSTWVTQLEQHTRRDSLKVYLYHGERTRDLNELMRHDIVLTTYQTLASEYGASDSPLHEIEWLRVIIDEAHVIKNFAAQQTKAVIALKAKRRWVVTGTPIQNGPFDLFSLMAFLRFQPFSIKSYWRSLVQRPLDQGNKNGISRLQALMGSISLRRLKETMNGNKGLVGLPPKTIETCFVELSSEERERYDQMESEAQNVVREYISEDTVLRNYSTVLHIILRLRQICNDVELCPSDIKSFLSSSNIEDVSKNPDLLRKLGSMIDDGDDFDCPVCLSPPIRTIITRCTHIFCKTCILKTLKHLRPCCPICRGPLSQSDLFVAPRMEHSDFGDPVAISSERPVSSKVSTLLKLLQGENEANPAKKSVVFSQFTKMLGLLEKPLRNAGFNVLRLDGSMTMKKRSAVMREFEARGPGTPNVLLASLKAAGTGINLTAASTVYLVEPWWNPAVEEQAMDRVHRIGQQEEVRVVRLIVRDSVEERILELQGRKKKLAGGVFGRKAANEQKQLRVEDIRTMIRM